MLFVASSDGDGAATEALEESLAIQYRERIQAAVNEWFAALQRSSLCH